MTAGLTFRDIVGVDPHPYAKFFDEKMIQKVMCIEQQRRYAEAFRSLNEDMEKSTIDDKMEPRMKKVMDRINRKMAAKKATKET